MSLKLERWLDGITQNRIKSMFYKLVEHLGMRIPIMAAQTPFEKGEVVYLALPPFLMPRYEDRNLREHTLGKVTITDIDESYGFFLARKGNGEAYYWLPGFFFHRNHTLAKETYQKQLNHMLKENKGKPYIEQEFAIPGTFITASNVQMDTWFYEEYEKPSISDLQERTKSLGF